MGPSFFNDGDNLEADYDGTGYDKANSTIGTTTTNSDMRGTDSASTHSAADVITALGTGTEVFGHSYLASVKRIEMASGNATLTGAGTGTEVLTSEDSALTATYTVDGSGNISQIVWA